MDSSTAKGLGVLAAAIAVLAGAVTLGRVTAPSEQVLIPNEGDVRFKVTCDYTHSARDDPIVYPNKPGAAHQHDFYGVKADAFTTTYAKFLALPTNCNDPDDHAGYWTPSVFTADGEQVEILGFTAYYRRGSKAGTIKPFPSALRMIGDAFATNGVASGFQCGGQPPAPEPYPCGDGQNVKMSIDFPDCWNGKRNDSTDHRSHMAYSVHDTELGYNVCPPTHPVQVPRIEIFINLDTDGTETLTLASTDVNNPTGAALSTLHADFVNGWTVARMAERVNTCLNGLVRCDSGG